MAMTSTNEKWLRFFVFSPLVPDWDFRSESINHNFQGLIPMTIVKGGIFEWYSYSWLKGFPKGYIYKKITSLINISLLVNMSVSEEWCT